MNNDMLNKAIEYAALMRMGQVRKGPGMPYIVYPMDASFTDDVEVIAAVVLHDVVEDTGVTVDEVRKLCDERAAMLVAGESEGKREGPSPYRYLAFA